MWPSVEAKLESIYATGKLNKGELDSVCVGELLSVNRKHSSKYFSIVDGIRTVVSFLRLV